MKKITTIIAAIYLLHIAAAQDAKSIKLLNTFHIQSAGGWDYLAIEPNSNKLFLSQGTQVNIVDKTTGDSLGVIPNTTGVHGIAFIPSLQKGYTSNGRLNSVTVFDLKTNAVLSQIKTGENPDAIFYDEFSKKLITCNGKSNNISIIDPATEEVINTLAVGGKPEMIVSNNAGNLFINIEDKNEIIVIDAKKFEMINHFALTPNDAPTGLAIDIKNNRLFSACSDSKTLVVVDAEKGNIVATVAIGNGCDGVVFDAATHLIYTSNGDGTLTIIKEETKDKFILANTISTKKSARTIAIDETTHKVYLPAADFGEAPANGGRPKMIAGSFQILVLGNL